MSNRRIMRLSLPILTAACIAPLTMVGCSGTSAGAFRYDPTPDVDMRAQTADGIENMLTITADTNFRLLNNDMGKLWLSDRPSRLTRGPKPY